MSKLPKLLPNTPISLYADDFMIDSEFFITRSDLIQSNLQTSLDGLALFNTDHGIILSCTKSVRVLFERQKSKRLNPQDITYNTRSSPSSSSVKVLGITLVLPWTLLSPSNLTFVLLPLLPAITSLKWIFSLTYGPSTLICLYKSFIHSCSIMVCQLHA